MGWRRTVRRVLAWSVGPPLVVLAAGLGSTLALLYSQPGRALGARALTGYLTDRIAGSFTIGRYSGNILRHVILEDVSLADSNGVVLLDAPRLEATWFLPELLAGRIIIRSLHLTRPSIHLARLRQGRWSYEEVFRSADSGDGSPPPRIELRDVTIDSGTLRVDAPTDPIERRQPITRHGATPAQPETLQSPDGLVRVYRAGELSGRFPLVRLSTPDGDPILVQVDSLAARLSDPAVRIVDLVGQVTTAGDSLQFSFAHAALPASRLSGEGLVRWPEGPIEYDFTMRADTVALADLLWVQPDFPSWSGRGTVTALSRSSRHTDFRLEELVLGDGSARAAGSLVAMVDDDRGFGVRDLDLALRSVPLDVMHPYLDTLPFRGQLTGRLQAEGYRELLTLAGQLDYTDATPRSRPTSRLVFAGDIAFGGPQGAVFQHFQLRSSFLDLATVGVMVPAVVLPGRLRLVGRLDGPWRNAQFEGTAEHLAINDALSRMTGTVRFDTRREVVRLAMDSRFDRLSFDGLRTGYPALTPRGGLVGRIVARGPLDSLRIDADVSGDIGEVVATGVIAVTGSRYAFDSLALAVRRLDAELLLDGGLNTAITGRIVLRGVIDSGAPPRGLVTLDLDPSRFGGVTVDGMVGRLRSDGRMLEIDTLAAQWPDGRLLAVGSIGWADPDSGEVRIEAAALRLTALDSLVRSTLGLEPDTLLPRPFDGFARVQMTVRGSLADPGVHGVVEAEELVLDGWSLAVLGAEFDTDTLATSGVSVDASADSLAHGDYLARDLRLGMQRVADSLTFAASGRLREAIMGIAGWRTGAGSSARLGIDSLGLALPRQQWRLERPVVAAWSDRQMSFDDPVQVTTTDGSGSITLIGSIPGGAPGDLSASIVGFELGDLYAVLERDTNAVGGIASVDFRLSGTRQAPLLRGNAMVTGPAFRGANPPLVRAAFDYRDRLLRSNLTFWKTGDPVLEVDLSVPYDLALAERRVRRLPGDIEILAVADSADLSILEAFTRNIRLTTGTMALDLSVTGSWDAPRLDGELAIIRGRTTIPALNVRYSPIDGHATFVSDSMVIDTLLLSSGEADLIVKGSVRFEDLARPVLDLRLESHGFLAINVPGFLVLRPTGTASLTGPVTQPVLSGNEIRVDDSELYFADLLNKDVINLEDPRFADLIDQDEVRSQRLGAAFQNRFLDSLRIVNLPFRVGSNVWLRSSEANIQLTGEVRVEKVRKDYRLTGTFNTPRGNYTLKLLGAIYRDFEVERGSVRYSGTPDLNADLDVTARHNAPTSTGDEIPVVAHITGTILVPRIELSSPGRSLTERDLVSYMMFGAPESQLGQTEAGTLALQSAVGAIAGEFENTVLGRSSPFAPDVFRVQPGVTGIGETGSFTRFAAGWQLGPRWFVTLNAGFCVGGQQAQQITARNFGASIEYRFARDWRVQASAEPVQSCLGGRLSDAFSTISRRYQLGADLLWEKEY
jgi:translocation and assembly module TamB